MKTARSGFGRLAAMGLALALVAPGLHAQTTTMPSTLRYGSGLLDVPVATVLPHLAITGTFSGFFVNTDRELQPSGGYGPGIEKFYQDASVAVGLFDRVEVGATLQSLNEAELGGNLFGLFGRLALLRPEDQGLGLAVGSRWVTSPSYDAAENGQYEPTRLGTPDRRFLWTDKLGTEVTFYGVSSVHFHGFEQDFLPAHDFTATLGYGTGMFQDGEENGNFYSVTNSNGWFFGSAVHFGLAEDAMLSLMGEYNGWDVNVGAQVDVKGIRVGAHMLGMNYSKPDGGWISSYRSRKFGILGSVALCPAEGGLCKPHLMDRPAPQTVQLPAPPPDTVRITREVERALPNGTPATVCLATGEGVQIRVTAQGDTLVGPMRQNIDDLRPGVVFAGTYAQGAGWFQNDDPITFENRRYDKSGNEVRLDCGQIMRVGEHMGVGLFAMRNADRPFQMVYVPVRPGVWQAYEFGLQRTRGQ